MGRRGKMEIRETPTTTTTTTTKTHYRKDIRQFWELGPEIFTIERFLEGAEDCNDKIFTSAADRQVGPAEKHVFSFFGSFSANSSPFASRLSLMVPNSEAQQTGKSDLTTGSFWSAHRQSKVDFGPFSRTSPGATLRSQDSISAF